MSVHPLSSCRCLAPHRWSSWLRWLVCSVFIAANPATAATFIVNSTADSGDAVNDAFCATGILIQVSDDPVLFAPECTLRAAIEQANALPGLDTVDFSAIPFNGAGVANLTPASTLVVFGPILIDGYTAPTYNPSDPLENPVVQIDASSQASGSGLWLTSGADGSIVRGLAIFGAPAAGVLLSSGPGPAPSGVTIEGCHLGVARGQFYTNGNATHGIHVLSAANITIGKTCESNGCTGRGNLISANGQNGVEISADSVSVAGNLIGTDAAGQRTFVNPGGATSNGRRGVEIFSGTGNSIGQSHPESGNLISGNTSSGIRIWTPGNVVLSNKIGTDIHGINALPNQLHGVDLSVGDNFVGSGVGGNLISGNAGFGVVSDGDNDITGNTIGLTGDQLDVLTNGSAAVTLYGSGARVVENVIGGDGTGIDAFGANHLILSNWIGTNAQGDDLSDGMLGIRVAGNAIRIGNTLEGNTVGYYDSAIRLDSGTQGGSLVGNFIGVDENGQNIAGAFIAVDVQGSFHGVGATDGLTTGAANVIGFYKAGIVMAANASTIRGNYIGTDALGSDFGVQGNGIEISGGGNNIGAGTGLLPDDVKRVGNIIAYSGESAVTCTPGPSTVSNSIRGNTLLESFELPIDLDDDGASANDVGDADAGCNNLQNSPEFDIAQTHFDEATGALEVRYRVDSTLANAVYPLTVDFYLRDAGSGGAEVYVGSDTYPSASATLFRTASVTPLAGVDVEGFLTATATDTFGNTSELSTELVPVPEPGRLGMLAAGMLLCLGLRRRA